MTIFDHLGPFLTTLGHLQACHVWPFFWFPHAHLGRIAMAETGSNKLGKSLTKGFSELNPSPRARCLAKCLARRLDNVLRVNDSQNIV